MLPFGLEPQLLRQVWRLALPVIFTNLLMASVNIADVFMVGRLGPIEIAAVGIANTVRLLVLVAMGDILNWLIANAEVPRLLAEWIKGVVDKPWTFLLVATSVRIARKVSSVTLTVPGYRHVAGLRLEVSFRRELDRGRDQGVAHLPSDHVSSWPAGRSHAEVGSGGV